MSVHELNPAVVDALPDNALNQLKHWAATRPLQIALRHKRRGRWKAWRWVDVLREVVQLGVALQQQGFGPGSRLALCGAFEPRLILLALAARAAGGQAFTVSRAASGEELRRLLLRSLPGHAFVQSREGVSQWLAAAAELPRGLLLFSAQSAPRQSGRARVLPLAELEGGGSEPLQQSWRAARKTGAVWSEEGTEWEQGLALLLRHWLVNGESFAFPENSESAARDRRDIAPIALLLSPSRLQALADEIENRLAPAGSWRRRLCDWTLSDARHGLRRLLKARVRALLGFPRLQTILRSAPDAQAAPAASHAWIREYREQAA